MDKKGISTISPQGKINLRTMYEVIFFLETGMKIPGSIKRVPEKTKKNILKKYNGATINNFLMKLNWVNSHLKDKNEQKKYTVSNYYIN